MGRSTTLLIILLTVLTADIVGNHGIIVSQLLGYLFTAGHWAQTIFDSIASFFTTGR